VSTEAQAADDRASIPSQRAINRRTAQAYGLEIVRSIELSDVSGAQILAAPEMRELLKLIADPLIHGVVAREFSRVMRPENFYDYHILQIFADTRTLLYLPDGAIDFSSRMGRLMGVMQAAFAGDQRLELLAHSWNSKEEKRRAGKFPQSKICLPFGVGYEESSGWFYKPEAERIRKAFTLVLSGDTSYCSISEKVGIAPFNLRNLLRNPIFKGWRVIDKQRDRSPGAKKVKADGRQADRPKIMRAPDEVIRVRVIDEPLVSEEEFERVQAILAMKKSRHWRTRSDYQHRYTYNGFLICICGDLIYTGRRRSDYYICKARRMTHSCDTRYMRRDVLEQKLDELFATRLTDENFLSGIVERMGNKPDDSSEARISRLSDEIESLTRKRERIMDAYFEGDIERGERDARLSQVEADIERSRNMLVSVHPPASVSVNSLASVFAPFFEFQFLKREDKRRLLKSLTAEIKVADYRVHELSFSSNEINRKDRDSSRSRA
jgi:DNA invertase Pin-like site-specific DNA recombinase